MRIIISVEIILTVDGAERVKKNINEKPVLVVMDMSLTVRDGWEATKHLKANNETAKIQIIALTAHAMAQDKEKALAAGCDEYDTKPIDLNRLLSKISSLT